MARESAAARLLAALGAVAVVTVVMTTWLQVTNAATVSTTYLLVILLVATTSRLWIAVVTSVAAMFCLNFFFLPPIGTLTIAEPQNWVALFAFLVVSLVASNLSAVARARTDEAVARRDELARLFDLGRDVLTMTGGPDVMRVLARSIARRFDLTFVAVALPRQTEWDVFTAGADDLELDARELANAFAAAQTTLEFDARTRTYGGHRTLKAGGRDVRLVPLRAGTKPIGLLASAGRPIEAGTLDALGGVVAIAIERVAFLEERKAGELTAQSEQLKTALLASIGHDLRTPLTAIRIAAGNVRGAGLTAAERDEQGDLILAEVERLTRLFENLLEMARLDAGGVTTQPRWTHPSEIVDAARGQVERTLQRHPVSVAIDVDVPVRLDPRMTAAALAHLLENAAQYAPPGSPIEIQAGAGADGFTAQVRDHGPGIAPGDLPHLFERFYRGATSRVRASGTGMGLWIARGLLAVQRGRVWAENAVDGGARFTLVVPAEARPEDAPAISS